MLLFDTHAHLNDPAFDPDREELMNGLAAKGVGFVMNAGCSLESSRDIVNMPAKYPWLYGSVGSHPDSADEVNEEVIEEYRKLCQEAKALNIPLEINLLGLRTNRHYPDRRLFEIAAQVGNKIVLGVDAHNPHEFHHKESVETALQWVKEMNLELIDKPFI